MLRFVFVAALAALFAIPTSADAGPLHLRERAQEIRSNLQNRIHQMRNLPYAESGSRNAESNPMPSVFTPRSEFRIPNSSGCPGGVCPIPRQMPRKPASDTPPSTPGSVVWGLGDTLKHRMLVNHAREKAVDGFVTQGLTHEQGRAKVARIDDATILAGAEHYGALGDAKIVQTIEQFLAWLKSPEGKAAIANLVKLIMTLAALFGDADAPEPVEMWLTA